MRLWLKSFAEAFRICHSLRYLRSNFATRTYRTYEGREHGIFIKLYYWAFVPDWSTRLGEISALAPLCKLQGTQKVKIVGGVDEEFARELEIRMQRSVGIGRGYV